MSTFYISQNRRNTFSENIKDTRKTIEKGKSYCLVVFIKQIKCICHVIFIEPSKLRTLELGSNH